MTRTTTSLAVQAECADALMTARRAKNWLFLLLLLFLLAQLTVFLLVRFKVLKLDERISVSQPPAVTVAPVAPATAPADGVAVSTTDTGSATPPAVAPDARVATSKATAGEILRYVIPVIDFLGTALAIVLGIVLLLLVAVMLVGRTMGASHATSAFVWCALLAVLLFPWQAFLISRDASATGSVSLSPDTVVAEQPAFKIPGVLYTYAELQADYDFPNKPIPEAVLKWGRYVGMPLLAILILMMVQTKSSRALRFALGEADVHIDVTTHNSGADLGV